MLLAVNLTALARMHDFPWSRFSEIARWALVAYLISAGVIEYAFVRNDVRGDTLVVLTLALAVYAVHVPTLIAFTVARYHHPEAAPAGRVAP